MYRSWEDENRNESDEDRSIIIETKSGWFKSHGIAWAKDKHTESIIGESHIEAEGKKWWDI